MPNVYFRSSLIGQKLALFVCVAFFELLTTAFSSLVGF